MLKKTPTYFRGIAALDTEGLYSEPHINVISLVHQKRPHYPTGGVILKSFTDFNFDYQPRHSATTDVLKPYINENLPSFLKIPSFEQAVIPDLPNCGLERVDLSDRSELNDQVPWSMLIPGKKMDDVEEELPVSETKPHNEENTEMKGTTAFLERMEAEHQRDPQNMDKENQYLHPSNVESFKVKQVHPCLEQVLREQTPPENLVENEVESQNENILENQDQSPRPSTSHVASVENARETFQPVKRKRKTLEELFQEVPSDQDYVDMSYKSRQNVSEIQARKDDKIFKARLNKMAKTQAEEEEDDDEEVVRKRKRPCQFIIYEAEEEDEEEEDEEDDDEEEEDDDEDEDEDDEIPLDLGKSFEGLSDEEDTTDVQHVRDTMEASSDVSDVPNLEDVQNNSTAETSTPIRVAADTPLSDDDDDVNEVLSPRVSKLLLTDYDQNAPRVKRKLFPTTTDTTNATKRYEEVIEEHNEKIKQLEENVKIHTDICSTNKHDELRLAATHTFIDSHGNKTSWLVDENDIRIETKNNREFQELAHLEEAKNMLKAAQRAKEKALELSKTSKLPLVAFQGEGTEEVLHPPFPHEKSRYSNVVPPLTVGVPSSCWLNPDNTPHSLSQESTHSTEPASNCSKEDPLLCKHCKLPPNGASFTKGQALDHFFSYILREEFRNFVFLAHYGSG